MSLQPGEVPRVVGGRSHELDVAPEPEETRDGGEPFGSLSLRIRIGSQALRLEGLDAELESLIRGNYDGFLAEDEAQEELVVELLRSERSAYLHLPRAEGRSEEARLDARFGDDGLELWSYFFASRFDREATSGRLLLCDSSELDRSQAIENFLRFFVATRALHRGGFLLHSSGVVRNGRAVVFFGPSGAGKSTTAANSPDTERLGDDLVLIEPQGPQRYRAHGVPFRGSFAGAERNENAGAPLALACRLVQSEENRLEDTRASVQAAELVSQLPFLLDDPSLRARAMDCVRSFVQGVPVKRLHLRRDPSFWELLDEQLDPA